MNNAGIKFMPLYLVYHDSWINRVWDWSYWTGWQVGSEQRHRGHMHFFMPEYPIKNTAQKGKAYSGKQSYTFSLESLWGPNSGDPNQAENTEFVGTPKWYFEITEYWRRVYIQPWDDHDVNASVSGIVGRKGIKYDAASPETTYGPFREGRDYFFFYDRGARALPIEYFRDSEKKYRDNFLYGAGEYRIPEFSNEKYVAPVTKFFIPKGGFVDRPMGYRLGITGSISPEQAENGVEIAKELGATYVPPSGNTQGDYTYSDDFGAFQQSFNDIRYIHPIIEYQKLVHLNWERLPGWEQRDAFGGGDGFNVVVSLPFEINGKEQSPFSDDSGLVSPCGEYHHGFEQKFPKQVLRYPKYDKCDVGIYQWRIVTSGEDGEEIFSKIVMGKDSPHESTLEEGEFVSKDNPFLKDDDGDAKWGRNPDPKYDEWRTPDHLKGQKVVFKVPDGMPNDGVWVEQCLGGVVRAKAVVTTRDNFGEVKEHEVSTTKFFLNELFEGSDQNASEKN